MAKVISQETFNEVVAENINEFDMSEEEAVLDAVKQFQSQGVNLMNIIRDPKKAKLLTENLEKLHGNDVNEEELAELLANVQLNGLDDMSLKLFAAKKGLYDILITCAEKDSIPIKKKSIEVLVKFMDGYPDLLDERGRQLLLSLLDPSTPEEILKLSLKWLVVSVKKHETARAALIKNNVALKIAAILKHYKDFPESVVIVKGVCDAIQILIQDDDVRVVHGNAHEHARELANQMLTMLPGVICQFRQNKAILPLLLSCVTSLLVRNEYCVQFFEIGGHKEVLEAVLAHMEDPKVVAQCFWLMKALAGSDEVKEPIASGDNAALFVNLLEMNFKHNRVALAGCQCIGALSLRSPTNSQLLAASNAPEIIVKCMNEYQENLSILKSACSAIRNQVSRCPELREKYRELEVEELLRKIKSDNELSFEAKRVLVDLGCDVKLKEEWHGTGVQLQ